MDIGRYDGMSSLGREARFCDPPRAPSALLFMQMLIARAFWTEGKSVFSACGRILACWATETAAERHVQLCVYG